MAYWQSTRHPAPCLFFTVPLLIVYEFGVYAVGGANAATLRNGADAWLRSLFSSAGLPANILAPLLIILILVTWAYRRRNDPPDNAPEIMLGMAIESVAYAVALWVVSRGFGPMLDALGVHLSVPAAAATPGSLPAVITFIGAGIYEEVIFRLGVFSGLKQILSMAFLPAQAALFIAAAAAALAFAAVHHIGPYGEPMNTYVFVFRASAGVLFTAIFMTRGFGIAVGTHALYDILAGVAM